MKTNFWPTLQGYVQDIGHQVPRAISIVKRYDVIDKDKIEYAGININKSEHVKMFKCSKNT